MLILMNGNALGARQMTLMLCNDSGKFISIILPVFGGTAALMVMQAALMGDPQDVCSGNGLVRCRR